LILFNLFGKEDAAYFFTLMFIALKITNFLQRLGVLLANPYSPEL